MRIHPYSGPANCLPRECYSDPGVAVFVTIRAYRLRPFEGDAALNDEVVRLLGEMRGGYGCWVGAYCLMPDHLHFIAGPMDVGASLLELRDRFKGRSTNRSWSFGWQGRLWQSRSYDRLADGEDAVEAVSRYILENPVRAELVSEVGEWRWSGVFDSRCG